MSTESVRRKEWEALYADLVSALAPFGRENPHGDGDFWVVDDDWGGYQHKICVSQLSFLTGEVAEAVQRALVKYSLPWEVVIALDFADPSRPPDGEGVLVRKSAIDSHWDARRLSQKYGAQFRWERK
jgi:hypothetical protein